jgi:DNA helicase II / ATP-dependent DNA helicase PcrA
MSERLINDNVYQAAYAKLNDAQKKAVDAIYGPYLVIAGPGTGKTQLLAMRVCNILRMTDMNPNNILCLTYTDSGVNSMRNRLVSFLGSTAYEVGIYTFHAFCSKVISENSALFSDYKELTIVEAMDLDELMEEFIDDIPLGHELKRTTGEIYFNKDRFKELFATIKKEGWTQEYMQGIVDNYPEFLQQDQSYYNKRTGELNAAYRADLEKIHFFTHAFPLIELYNKKLRSKNFMDFDDVINFVIHQLKNNEDFKLRYQEQFQFVLADEYQDTNGSQNEIIFSLTDYDDQPNVFVVGDDDQAIFRFQGASMSNISSYIKKFNPQVFVLTENYRSHQAILDKGMGLIDCNAERLSKDNPAWSKNLVQKATITKSASNMPKLYTVQNIHAQNILLIDEIKRLYAEGVDYKDIAIIYKNHNESENLINFLNKQDIPVKIAKQVNALIQPDGLRIITLLKYFNEEMTAYGNGNEYLFEILHYDFFNLQTQEISKFCYHLTSKKYSELEKVNFRDALGNESLLKEIGIKNFSDFLKASEILEELCRDMVMDMPNQFFEKVITKTGFLHSILRSAESSWRIQVVNCIFDNIKNLSKGRDSLTISEILSKFERRIERNLPISVIDICSEPNGVQCMTFHASKGMEFKHVYLISLTESVWKKRNSKFAYPKSLLLSTAGSHEEESRRLFYVGITRAMEQCTFISYVQNLDGKEINFFKYIHELDLHNDQFNIKQTEENKMIDYESVLLLNHSKSSMMVDHKLVTKIMENFKLSITHLNAYMACPTSFYYNFILKIPKARTASQALGIALHYAIEKLCVAMEQDPQRQYPSLEDVYQFFEIGLRRYRSDFSKSEFEQSIFAGKEILNTFYTKEKHSFTSTSKNFTELRIENHVEDIPIMGVIDRIGDYADKMEIYDYKFSKHKSSKLSEKNIATLDEGTHWRQAIFYHLLLNNDPRFMKSNKKFTFNYLREEMESNHYSKTVTVDDADKLTMIDLIKINVQKMRNHEFEIGCVKQDCNWCNFTRNNLGVDSELLDFEDDDKDLLGSYEIPEDFRDDIED